MKEHAGPHRTISRNDGPQTRNLSGGRPQGQNHPGWCYLCKSQHWFAEPCPGLAALPWYEALEEAA